MFRGHSTEDFISLSSSRISVVLSALISPPAEALPKEKQRGRAIARVLLHHPRNIDCLITVALQSIINTTGVTEAEEEERGWCCCFVSAVNVRWHLTKYMTLKSNLQFFSKNIVDV